MKVARANHGLLQRRRADVAIGGRDREMLTEALAQYELKALFVSVLDASVTLFKRRCQNHIMHLYCKYGLWHPWLRAQ